MTPEEFAAKRQRRIDRLEERSQKQAAEAESRFGHARKLGDQIPLGQPILVGHHSEGRHRAHLARIDTNMRKGVEADAKARNLAARALGASQNRSIFSDDPEAVQKLLAKVEALEALQAMMKATNRVIRSKKLTDEQKRTEIAAIPGMTEERSRTITRPDICGHIGYPSYRLTNNNATIRKARERIEMLRRAPTETEEDERDGVTIVKNADLNRLQLVFPCKPNEAARKVLKSRGYRWSRSEGAWQRHLNGSADWLASSTLDAIEAAGGYR